MTKSLSNAFVRDAFYASGEKRYALARVVYPYLLGPDWRWAIVGWAYLKCLDDMVDEDTSTERSIEVLESQREMLKRIYDGGLPDPGRSAPECYGERFCAWDRSCGAPLRTSIDALLETIEFDLRRRGSILSREEIDAYLLKIGGTLIDFLIHFAAPGLVLSDALHKAASRAYLYADTLMDLAHDLEFGLINIPVEDVEAAVVDLGTGFEGCRLWVTARVPEVENYFDEAISLMRELPPATRVWCRFLLTNKRKAFQHFLDKAFIPYNGFSNGNA